jgi:hypothetical protein
MALLCATLATAGDALDGTITGGKAKKLVDKAYALIKVADEAYRSWVLEHITGDNLMPALKNMVAAYTEASDLLQEALDIQEDPGALAQQRKCCMRIAKLRAQIFYRRPKPKRPPPTKPAGDAPEPDAKPAPDAKPEKVESAQPALERPTFTPGHPPATPADADLPVFRAPEGDADYEKLVKADRAGIARLFKEYYGARKANKLHFRHRLCRGKGCDECHGTGRQVNLYFFRKAFWNCFSPSLREADGARTALKAFHRNAHSDPAALGPVIKSFKVVSLDYHGYWARAKVLEGTKRGKREVVFALISAGGNWYFFTSATDRELIPSVEIG